MPDFLAIFDVPGDRIRGRVDTLDEPQAGRDLAWNRWPWGWLGVNPKLWRRVQGDGLVTYICGRPARRAHGGDVERSIAGALDGSASAYHAISGMFLVLQATRTNLALVTDRFAHRPAYATARQPHQDCFAISSNVEWIIDALRTAPAFDDVSLAELLLWNNATYPYTTRDGIHQLAPGSLHEVTLDQEGAASIGTTTLWQPREPNRWPGKRACIEACAAGVGEAAREITANASRIGVLLSGGLDSRIIAATLSQHAEVETFTYCDRPNPETDSAARTASVLGLPHHLVRRDPQFYAHAFVEGQRVLGYEQNSLPCHALCVADHPAIAGLDVVVSGFGCDILLKGAYVPYSMVNVLLQHHRLRRLPYQERIGKHNYSHVLKRKSIVCPELVAAAFERRDAYERSLREIRPDTAEEWMGFYPISHTTSIDSTLISRYFPHDEFFFRAGLVEASMATPWAWKKGLDLISRLALRVAPTVARLPHPDTGYPATMTYLPSRVVCKVRPRKPVAPVGGPGASTEPWFSQGSFINYAKFLAQAPAWRVIRDEAMGRSEAISVLQRILTVDPADTFGTYAEQYDSLLNATVVQILRMAGRA
ncbi:MAG: asparagine synthase-related protein [Phycisphaerales bacterium]